MEINDETFVQTVRDLVTESPDYIYSSPDHMKEGEFDADLTCFYVHMDEDGETSGPGCLVGKALHRLGIPLETLRGQEANGAREVIANLHLPLTAKVRLFASTVQGHQDDGDPWAVALRRGERALTGWED
jgi:hypothetical protein